MGKFFDSAKQSEAGEQKVLLHLDSVWYFYEESFRLQKAICHKKKYIAFLRKQLKRRERTFLKKSESLVSPQKLQDFEMKLLITEVRVRNHNSELEYYENELNKLVYIIYKLTKEKG